MDNRILRIALTLTRVSVLVTVGAYAAILLAVVYWHIAPEAFDHWYIINPFHAGGARFNFQRAVHPSGMTLHEIGRGPLYWLLLRTTVFFVLVIFALRTVLSILQAVRTSHTFYASNIVYFRQLAGIGVLYAAMSCFNINLALDNTMVYLKMPFVPLLFAAGSLVLAEVFREGTRLRQDMESIV